MINLMKSLKKISLVILPLLILILSSFINAVQQADIVIIVNNGNATSSMSIAEVKLTWLRKIKKRWPDNKPILPVDRKSKCAEQDEFYSKVLGMNAQEVEGYFTAKQYQNAEKPQDKMVSDAAIIEFVENNPGAIGFVNASSLSGGNKSRVKAVLTIQ